MNTKDIQLLLFKPVPLYLFVLTLTVFILLFALNIAYSKKHSDNYKAELTNHRTANCVGIIRENNKGLIRPLILVEGECDNPYLNSLKIKIGKYLDQIKQEGLISQASVYLNQLNTDDHIEINSEELYDPASLMKMPLLLLYLKKVKQDSSLLKKTILFDKKFPGSYAATITDKSIVEGHSYTVKELLYDEIVYSDNQAFALLAEQLSSDDFARICDEFEIPKKFNTNEEPDKPIFMANVNSISRFFKVIYNATYLGRKMSEYAMDLLVQSNFKNGILKGIDSNVKVAHKFGERLDDGVVELHEFGIVYLDGNNYLLGVMTKGKNMEQLEEVLGHISKITYDNMKMYTGHP